MKVSKHGFLTGDSLPSKHFDYGAPIIDSQAKGFDAILAKAKSALPLIARDFQPRAQFEAKRRLAKQLYAAIDHECKSPRKCSSQRIMKVKENSPGRSIPQPVGDPNSNMYSQIISAERVIDERRALLGMDPLLVRGELERAARDGDDLTMAAFDSLNPRQLKALEIDGSAKEAILNSYFAAKDPDSYAKLATLTHVADVYEANARRAEKAIHDLTGCTRESAMETRGSSRAAEPEGIEILS